MGSDRRVRFCARGGAARALLMGGLPAVLWQRKPPIQENGPGGWRPSHHAVSCRCAGHTGLRIPCPPTLCNVCPIPCNRPASQKSAFLGCSSRQTTQGHGTCHRTLETILASGQTGSMLPGMLCVPVSAHQIARWVSTRPGKGRRPRSPVPGPARPPALRRQTSLSVLP